LGENYKDVLDGKEKISLRKDKFNKKSDLSKNKKPKARLTLLNKTNETLFQNLRTHRSDLANEQKLPAYMIFHDTTLLEMAETKPKTLIEFGRLTGVGKVKLESYGSSFLKVILHAD
jgi:ATP-dependent DNA helicase RecQ